MKRVSITHAISKLRAGDSLTQYEWLNEFDFRGSSLGGKHCRFLQCVFHEPIILDDANNTVEFGLEFDHCTFKKPLNWARLTFHQPVTFKTCRFEGYVDCTESSFRGLGFEDCSFDEKSYFEKVIFNEPSSANSTALQRLNCGTASSSAGLECASCSRPCAKFRTTIFKDGAEFDSARFCIPACFHKAIFYETSTFRKCTFPKNAQGTAHPPPPPDVNFSYAQIIGSIEFQQSLRRLESSADGEIASEPIDADFRYIHVNHQQGLQFHTENLQRCKVLGTNLDACHFSNIRWPLAQTHYPLCVETILAKCVRISYPSRPDAKPLASPWTVIQWLAGRLWHVLRLVGFGGIWSLHKLVVGVLRFFTRWLVPHHRIEDQSTTFRQDLTTYLSLEQHCIYDHLEQYKEQDLELRSQYTTAKDLDKKVTQWRGRWSELSRAYRDLKTAYEENKDYIYASDFHYAEKEFRRINYEVPRQTRIQLQLYWLVSGYGERVLRPIWWFLLIWILGAIPYYLWGEPARHPLHETEQSASRTHLSNQ